MRGRIIASYRMVFGLLALATLVYQMAWLWGSPGFKVSNLLSYFSILSNLFAGTVLLITATAVWSPGPQWDGLRGAATSYLVMIGVVFALSLPGFEAIVRNAPPEANLVLHRVMPLVLVIDWLLDPPQRRLRVSQPAAWLLFPVAYLGYCLIRGIITAWYPYPFLNPAETGGYLAVAGWCLGIAGLAAAAGASVTMAGNRLAKLRKPLVGAPTS